jgi:hypothetical protein
MTYQKETVSIAKVRAKQIQKQFLEEVERLLSSGAIDKEKHNRGLLYGVALENIADNFLRGERKNKDYKNLKCF